MIQLGTCFDLMNEENSKTLALAYRRMQKTYRLAGGHLPRNVGSDRDLKGRYLDCLVLNYFFKQSSSPAYGTVRAAFTEGPPTYAGSMFASETHVQIAVRDRGCILGLFRPTFGL